MYLYWFILLFSYFFYFGTVLGPAVMQCFRNKVKVHDEKKYFELRVRLLSPSLPDAGQFLGTWRPVLGFCHRAISPSGHERCIWGFTDTYTNTHAYLHKTQDCWLVYAFSLFFCVPGVVWLCFFFLQMQLFVIHCEFLFSFICFCCLFFFYLSCSAVVVSRIMVWMLRCAKHIQFPRGSP